MTGMLADWQIEEFRKAHKITIEPFVPKNLGPNSYDLTAADTYVVYPDEPRIIGTAETIGVDTNVVGLLSPRSHWARKLVFSFSSLVDTGFMGAISMLACHPRPVGRDIPSVTIAKGERFCQVMFLFTEVPHVPYNKRPSSKNMNQTAKDLTNVRVGGGQ